MLAELCLTPPESRTPLIEQYFSKPTFSLSLGSTESRIKIAALFNQDAPVTPETILISMGATISALTDESELYELSYENFKSLDDASWIRLVAICDRYVLETASSASESIAPHALLYKIIERLVLDVTANPTSRINAYLFLRSQKYQVSFVGMTMLEDLGPLVCKAKNLHALSILLLDPYFPSNGVPALIEENAVSTEKPLSIADHVTQIIAWAIQYKATPNDIKTLIERFTQLLNPKVVKDIIQMGVNRECSLETLRYIFTNLPEIEDEDPLFDLFFINQKLKKFPDFADNTIDRALENFHSTMPSKGLNRALNNSSSSTVASTFQSTEQEVEAFSVFLAPELSRYPDQAVPTGMKIAKKYPQLLNACVNLISTLNLDLEMINFLADFAIELSSNWKSPIENAEELDENLQNQIKQEIRENIETKYSAQFEKFIKEYGFTDRAEAKSEFPDFALREQAQPIVDRINAEAKLAMQEKLQQIFSALTLASDYTGVEDTITHLMNHFGFHIQDYYVIASPAFKALPEVTITMQLYCFQNPQVQPAIIAEALGYAKRLHESGVSFPNDPNDFRLLGSRLAYRIVEDERINSPQDAVSQTSRAIRKSITTFVKQHLVNGKDAKIPFLRHILQHLMQHGEFSPSNTAYPAAPFIWSVYVDAYLPVKARMKFAQGKGDGQVPEEAKHFSPEKISKVNEWLKEQILETSEAPETVTLLSLPEDLRHAIFGFEGSEINPTTLQVTATARRSSILSWVGGAGAGSTSTSSATVEAEAKSSSAFQIGNMFRRSSSSDVKSSAPAASAGNS